MDTSSECKQLMTGSHIVAVTYPCRYHITPMINLSAVLASKGISVTFVVTEEWLGFINSLDSSSSPNITIRSLSNALVPSEGARTADFIGFIESVYTKMEASFYELLDRLDRPVACIVADTFLPWMTAVGSRRNIPVVSLWTIAPSVFSVYYHFDLLAARGHFPDQNLQERGEEIIDYLPGVSVMRLADLPSVTVGKTNTLKPIIETFSFLTKVQSILFTSFSELQPHVIDVLRTKLSIPIYTIGPSISYLSLKLPPPPPSSNPNHDSCFTWLNSQPEASVLYVSLDIFLWRSKEQMQELAMGLNASRVRFLWILQRDEDSISSLKEACGETGLMASWCDQLRVLCHPSVGGFLTDAEWNSTMESIYAGIPMLAFPLIADHIHNAKIIVDDLRVGLRLKTTVGLENVVGREEIAETVKSFMDFNGNEGKELRQRAKELEGTCHEAVEMGGSTDSNVNAFVRDFVQQGICKITT